MLADSAVLMKWRSAAENRERHGLVKACKSMQDVRNVLNSGDSEGMCVYCAALSKSHIAWEVSALAKDLTSWLDRGELSAGVELLRRRWSSCRS
jgi:hypothetical protein